MRSRPRHVSVWMNEAEYRHLKTQAELVGMGIDPFIRSLVAGVQLRPRPPDEYTRLLRELSAIGNNVNQIAHWANARKSIQNYTADPSGIHTEADGIGERGHNAVLSGIRYVLLSHQSDRDMEAVGRFPSV